MHALPPCLLSVASILALVGDPPPFGPRLFDVPAQLFAPAIEVCDLDHDGVQELLVSGSKSGLVHARVAADGSVTYATSDAPGDVRHAIAADLDGDGLEEVVVAGKHLYVLPNQGGFDLLGPAWAAGTGAHDHVAAVDVDGDGDLDLVATAGNLLHTYGNDGTHGFEKLSTVEDPVTWSGSVHGDFDGDGVVDVARLAGSTVRVRLGDGVGGWGAPVAYPVGSAFGPLRAGDVDGDGDVDLLVTRKQVSGEPRLLLCAGDGTFVDGPPLGGLFYSLYTYGADLLDLDGDGRCELLVGDAVGLFRIDDVTGTPAVARWPFAYLHDFAAVEPQRGGAKRVVGLVEVDSKNAWIKHYGLSVYDAASDSGFLDGIPVDASIVSSRADADLDGDGHLDRILYQDQATVRVLRGSADGWKAGEYVVELGAQIHEALDANGDGLPDLLSRKFLGGSTTAYRLHLNDGTGRFPDSVRFAPGWALVSVPVVVGDLDGDGDDDVAALTADGVLGLLLCQADGSVELGAEVPGVGIPRFADDLDGDGRLDLVLPAVGGDRLAFGDGHGGIRFLLDAPTLAGTTTRVLAAGDLDGDGLPELVTRGGDFWSEVLAVHTNLGQATWGAPQLLPSNRRANRASIADVDGDGRADLLTGLGVSLVLWRNDAVEGLVPREQLAWRMAEVLVHDVDGDGSPELIGSDGILTRGGR